jgi:Fe-S-cluster containining protein
MKVEQKECVRCGTCCKSGGPALHGSDLSLIRAGKINLDNLVTLRKGELAYNPKTSSIQPIRQELVKLVGKGKSWDCFFFDDQAGCTIYENRPFACRVLQCWEPEASLNIIEQDVLSREDIIDGEDPLLPFVREHDQLIPCDDVIEFYNKSLSSSQKKELETRMNSDLAFRSNLLKHHNLSLGLELFYLGRPFFQLLQQMKIDIVQSGDGLRCR